MRLVGPAAGGSADRHGFAESLADLALLLNDQLDEPETLSVITAGAAGVISGAEFAAVVAPAGPGRLEARAAQGALPPLVTALQNTAGQGPCLDAVTRTGQVRIAALAEETRWPRFVPRAAELGVGSMLCTPLTVGDQMFRSLSLVAIAIHQHQAAVRLR